MVGVVQKTECLKLRLFQLWLSFEQDSPQCHLPSTPNPITCKMLNRNMVSIIFQMLLFVINTIINLNN